MRRINLLCLCGLLITGCSKSPLDQALLLSGSNSGQLEQVLRHYSHDPGDSLKYKAARFLIENMPGHGWYEGQELSAYQKWIDSVYYDRDVVFKAALYEIFFQQPDAKEGLTRYEDIRNLDSDFLIAHIDSTFRAVERRPWLRLIAFDQFCEYILPYRVGRERPQLLFRLQDSLFQSEVSDLLNYEDTRESAQEVFSKSQLYDLRGRSYAKIRYRGSDISYDMVSCPSLAAANNWKGKLLMCPITLDFIPAYPNRNDRHSWSILIDNSLVGSIHYLSKEPNVRGKIYRSTFSHHPHPVTDSTEFVPPFFRIPFHRDVTSLYTRTKDVRVKPILPVNTSYGYLCVFNDLKWEPVACTEVREGHLDFKDVGCGVAYLPVVYPDKQAVAASYPFILRILGQMQVLQPDTTRLMTLKLENKYPLKFETKLLNRKFLNSILEASNDVNFKRKDTLGIFADISRLQWAIAGIRSSQKYRYWRIYSNSHLALRECVLYDRDGNKVSPVLSPEDQESDIAAFDDDPLTYSRLDRDGYFTIDLGQEMALSKVECLLCNNGNEVWPGHWYELNYHDGKGWYSLGAREAEARFIEFDGVPANALLWLRDLTTGKQERIFTYENGRICFW